MSKGGSRVTVKKDVVTEEWAPLTHFASIIIICLSSSLIFIVLSMLFNYSIEGPQGGSTAAPFLFSAFCWSVCWRPRSIRRSRIVEYLFCLRFVRQVLGVFWEGSWQFLAGFRQS